MALALALALGLIAAGCGDDTPPRPAPGVGGALAPLLAPARAEGERVRPDRDASDARQAAAGFLLATGRRRGESRSLEILAPLDGSVFPPDMVAPTFLWRDADPATDAWWVHLTFADGGEDVVVLVPGAPPPPGEIDPETLGSTNEVYEPDPARAPQHAWTPPPDVWDEIRRRSVESPARVVFQGFRAEAPDDIRTRAGIEISISRDPVGAPIFYRDVPLMPAEGLTGVIQPLAQGAIPLINWRLRDISLPESRVVLSGMPSCANCHSFSNDGSTLAMDVDGPQGDKGAYAIAPITREMLIGSDEVITWNSYAGKPEGHKTIGFLSRISPTGKYALTTLNEALYVANFRDYRFLQVFYPTRGILAWYSTETGEMEALPGADDTNYVHCNGVWSPDGKWIVFSRAEAFDPYSEGKPLAIRPNDPNEPRIQYDLYRMPFADGKGGTPERIEGASQNGMSNTFPKVSPDGKWIVYTKCRNGQLMRPDGRLWIVPFEGGEAREMACNTALMNSWHSWSPNSRWLVFSSKVNTPYTQMFLTHVDDEGNSTPPVLIPNSTAANRAVNIPEFVNIDYDDLQRIEVPAVNHYRHLWDAMERIRAREVAEAIPHLELALAKDPNFAMALVNLGYAKVETGHPGEALVPLQRAIDVDPTSGLAWHNMGFALGRLERFAEAEKHYQEALRRNPIRALTWSNLGWVVARQGRERLEEAVAHIEKALSLDVTLALAWRNLALVRLWQGRYRAALDPANRAVELEPRDPALQRILGDVHLSLGEGAQAAERFERVLELAPDDYRNVALQLAWLRATSPHDAVRDGGRAVVLAEQVRDGLTEDRADVYDVLAAAYAEAGRFEDAVTTARRALELSRESDTNVAEGLEDRVRLYEAGRAYRRPRRGP